MSYRIAYKINPNNETRLTLYRVRGSFVSLRERAALCLGASTEEVFEQARSVPDFPSNLTFVPNSKRTNPSVLENSHARTKFGHAAVSRIYHAAGALDRFDSTRSNYLFLTATLPGDTEEAKWGIAEYAHEIINGLKAWLSKRLPDRKEFYVWENQQRGALHFHYCLYCPSRDVQAEITANFKAQIVRLYDGIQKKHDCNLWGYNNDLATADKIAILQARVEVVYGSVGAYMAGYLAGKAGKHSNDSRHRYYPKRWFGVSRPLSALIDSYTEESVHEFDSFATANNYFHQIKEDIFDGALTTHSFPHKIGEGKTAVAFHPLEKQQELWQAQKMLTHSPIQHPNISAYVSTALRTTRELQALSVGYKSWLGSLPPNSQRHLEDATSATSMKVGALSRVQIKALTDIFLSSDLSTNSSARIRKCSASLRKFNQLTSQWHSQMNFNPAGWLNNEVDFIPELDSPSLPSYAGTSTENGGCAPGAIESSGRVPRDSAPSFIQVELPWS
jgi:hypothetical protein